MITLHSRRRGLLAGLAVAVALCWSAGPARAGWGPWRAGAGWGAWRGPAPVASGTWYGEPTWYHLSGPYPAPVKVQRWLTIRPDGTFTDVWRGRFTGVRGGDGLVLRRGAYLVFRYNDGRVWRARYLPGGPTGLRLDGVPYVRGARVPLAPVALRGLKPLAPR
jgi:hypothetical protein